MIPTAAELKEELALRRAVEIAAASAPNPEAAVIQSTVLLDQIKYELEVARQEHRASRRSVNIPFNFREKHNPSLNQIRLFLIARGYVVTVETDFIVVSWN